MKSNHIYTMVFSTMLLLYKLFVIYEFSIKSFVPSFINGDTKYTIASTTYTIIIPFITPYIVPPEACLPVSK